MVRVDGAGWRDSGVRANRVREAVHLSLARGVEPGERGSTGGRSLTIFLADDERLRALNKQFRGKDSPTNVLAFPAPVNESGYLGDVAIAFGTAVREAAVAGTGLSDHVLHLTVHGVLHLLGYDHAKAHEARTMERLEIAVLRELGVANPYAAHR